MRPWYAFKLSKGFLLQKNVILWLIYYEDFSHILIQYCEYIILIAVSSKFNSFWNLLKNSLLMRLSCTIKHHHMFDQIRYRCSNNLGMTFGSFIKYQLELRCLEMCPPCWCLCVRDGNCNVSGCDMNNTQYTVSTGCTPCTSFLSLSDVLFFLSFFLSTSSPGVTEPSLAD